MHGDFSRDSFERNHNFARLLMQQGRLIVDADWNEQTAILLHFIQSLATDVIGWHGGPSVVLARAATGGGTPVPAVAQAGPFCVTFNKDTKKITLKAHDTQFRYYVDGLMVEAKGIAEQEVVASNPGSDDTKILVYLDVCEAFIPSFSTEFQLLDPALNGRDTCARSQILYSVRALKVKDAIAADIGRAVFLSDKRYKLDQTTTDANRLSVDPRSNIKTGTMLAKTVVADNSNNCIPEPGQGYVGLENQLYRIEIHRGGIIVNPDTADAETLKNAATFKWSRDNGSICYPGKVEGQTIRLLKNWLDASQAIEPKNIVEVLVQGTESGALHRVTSIGDSVNGIHLEFEAGTTLPANDAKVFVRRWDHTQSQATPLNENGIVLRQKENLASVEIPIEDGIAVQFQLPDAEAKFFPGDYWLIPARAATGGVMWSKDDEGNPVFVPARFINHHYAPIALIPDTNAEDVTDLRRAIVAIAK